MSAKIGTIVLLCMLGLAAAPSAHAAGSFTGSATGTASVWASFHGVTCSNWQTASFSGSYAAGTPYAASASSSAFSISVSTNTLTCTSSAASPCNAQSVPVLGSSIDCAAGTAVIDAGIQGQAGVSLDVSGVTCSGVGGSDVLCFGYDPDALTNACVTAGQQPESVPSATPVVGSQTVGVPTPVVGTASQVVEVPTVGGYVEVTACATSLCHVEL